MRHFLYATLAVCSMFGGYGSVWGESPLSRLDRNPLRYEVDARAVLKVRPGPEVDCPFSCSGYILYRDGRLFIGFLKGREPKWGGLYDTTGGLIREGEWINGRPEKPNSFNSALIGNHVSGGQLYRGAVLNWRERDAWPKDIHTLETVQFWANGTFTSNGNVDKPSTNQQVVIPNKPPAPQSYDYKKCVGYITGWDNCIGEMGFVSAGYLAGSDDARQPFDFKKINPDYDGERYVGWVEGGRPSGWGVLYAPDGRVSRQGIWRYGRLERTTAETPEIRTLLAFHASNQTQTVAVAETVTAPAATSSASSEKEEIKRLRAQLAALQTSPANPPKQDTPVLADRRRVALVIGNSKYEVGALDNPANDARDMAAALKRQGFKVIKYDNLTLRQTQNAMRQFADEFKKSDVGLVYYSGHGVEAKGVNYLIPVNANIRREYELTGGAYPASQITGMMEEIQASGDRKRVAILILDACRDNPLTRSWRSSGGGLARMDAPAGTFISFATSPGSVASDGVGRNSPFTKHLLQAMKKPNVPIELMFKEVRVGVVNETRGEQVPWESSSLMGDFYFNRTK